jgi:hypothetical protein
MSLPCHAPKLRSIRMLHSTVYGALPYVWCLQPFLCPMQQSSARWHRYIWRRTWRALRLARWFQETRGNEPAAPRANLFFGRDLRCEQCRDVVIDPGTISPSGTSFAVRALSVLCCGGSSQAQRARDGESAVRRTTRAERIKSGVQVFTCKCDVFRWLGDLWTSERQTAECSTKGSLAPSVSDDGDPPWRFSGRRPAKTASAMVPTAGHRTPMADWNRQLSRATARRVYGTALTDHMGGGNRLPTAGWLRNNGLLTFF